MKTPRNKIENVNISSFETQADVINFIDQHNLMISRYALKIKQQEKIIEMMRDNTDDLLGVIRSQNKSVDLTDKLMEEDFGFFKDLLD